MRRGFVFVPLVLAVGLGGAFIFIQSDDSFGPDLRARQDAAIARTQPEPLSASVPKPNDSAKPSPSEASPSFWYGAIKKDPMTDVLTATAFQRKSVPTSDALGQSQDAVYELRFTCDASSATLEVRTFISPSSDTSNAILREIPGRLLAPDATVPITSLEYRLDDEPAQSRIVTGVKGNAIVIDSIDKASEAKRISSAAAYVRGPEPQKPSSAPAAGTNTVTSAIAQEMASEALDNYRRAEAAWAATPASAEEMLHSVAAEINTGHLLHRDFPGRRLLLGGLFGDETVEFRFDGPTDGPGAAANLKGGCWPGPVTVAGKEKP